MLFEVPRIHWVNPNNTEDFISGYFLHKKCKWVICPRYQSKFDSNNIQENDFVFLNTDLIYNFVKYLNENHPKNKFIIFTQNSDLDFTKSMFELVDNYTNKIFAINCSFSHKKVKKIPLGFNDQSTDFLSKENFETTKKQNLIYVNFKLHHHQERYPCMDYFKKQNWCSVEEPVLSNNVFYERLKTFKYCVCPRGTGIDTHRFYESLMFGTIPIVKKSPLDDLYEKFPAIIVNDWSEINVESLMEDYEKNIEKYYQWKSNNKDWFTTNYWIKSYND